VSLYYSINAFLTHLQTEWPPTAGLAISFAGAVAKIEIVTNQYKYTQNSLVLPEDFKEELRHAGLLNG